MDSDHRPHVVLVHGWNGWPGNWRPIADGLRAAGWEVSTPRLPIRPWRETVRHDAHLLDAYLRGAGLADKPLVLVGYSRGGLVNRAYLREFGHGQIRGVVDIGVPHQGAPIAGLRLLRPVAGILEMQQGAGLFEWLAGAPYPPAGCPELAIVGRASDTGGFNDLLVWEESATLGGRLSHVTIDLLPERDAWHGNLINRAWIRGPVPAPSDLVWPRTLFHLNQFLRRLVR